MSSKLLAIFLFSCIWSVMDGTKTGGTNNGCVISGMLQLQKELTELKTRLAIMEKTKERDLPRASFQVNLIRDPVPVSNYEILKFDEVTLNEGNAYNPRSGKFVAPVTGMYFFWANVMCKIRDRFAVYLIKDGRRLIRGYTGFDLKHGTATISYMLKLKKGNNVWFQNDEHGNTQTIIEGKRYSNYGGTLLYT